MSNKTRKRFLPVALVMAVGAIAVMALAIAMAGGPRDVQAHGNSPGDCSTDAGRAVHDLISPNDPCPTPTPDPTEPPSDYAEPEEVTITSDSTTSSGAPELKLTIAELGMPMSVGSSIVLYLEDDFQEPDSIPMTSVYLVAEEPTTTDTGSGSRVYVTQPVKIKTGAYFDEDKKDIAIRISVPDMCTTDTSDCQGANGLRMNQKVTLVIESDSGIKNPSEAGTHSVFYDLLGPADPIPSASNVRGRNDAMRDADPPTEKTLEDRSQDQPVRRGQQAAATR